MPPTEEAAFKSLKHPAQGPFCGECGTPVASQWRGSCPPDEDRIRRDARNAGLEECARMALDWSTSTDNEEAREQLEELSASISKMKVEVPRE